MLALLLISSGCEGQPWNDPYPYEVSASNQYQMVILFITHDLTVAKAMAD